MSDAIVSEDELWRALRRIIDPELDCDIVSLGLVYGVSIDSGCVGVTMTLTTRGCPMNEILPAAVQSVLEELPGVTNARVEVVWDPPWHFSRMSAAAQERLGVAGGA
jgi:metal-sulfur cluster biosynthetic enzyme